jgi:hypothetical protein
MQRLLEAPKPHIPTSVDPESTQMTEENEEVTAMTQKNQSLVKISVSQYLNISSQNQAKGAF